MSEEIHTPYMQNLNENADTIQFAIETLLEKYSVTASNDYIDLIVPRSNSVGLISELAENLVAVEMITWWCLCSPESKDKLGCPHGGGGPGNRYGEGYFSECYQYPYFEVKNYGIELNNLSIEPSDLSSKCARITTSYIKDTFPSEPFFSECLHPGLWLHVPQNWERRFYDL